MTDKTILIGMLTADKIEEELMARRNDRQALHLSRFFKTAKGQYGYGDRFLGLRVPQVRECVKRYSDTVNLDDIEKLISSPWHEIRLAAFLLLLELYNKSRKVSDKAQCDRIIAYYTQKIGYGNNWDLVDLVAPGLLGEWICENPGQINILHELSLRDGSLWHQRVAIVATFALIKKGIYQPTMAIAERYLTHRHDLIHKATGWMLREMGKRGGETQLKEFLNKHKDAMPRTMLRYAIERMTPEDKKFYMKRQKSES